MEFRVATEDIPFDNVNERIPHKFLLILDDDYLVYQTRPSKLSHIDTYNDLEADREKVAGGGKAEVLPEGESSTLFLSDRCGMFSPVEISVLEDIASEILEAYNEFTDYDIENFQIINNGYSVDDPEEWVQIAKGLER